VLFGVTYSLILLHSIDSFIYFYVVTDRVVGIGGMWIEICTKVCCCN